MKWFALVAAFGFVTSSQASFDLLLTPDAAGGVQRIDPKTGASLGKIGGVVNYNCIEASFSSGAAFMHDSGSGRFYRYNYSTGDRLGQTGSVSAVWSSLNQNGDTMAYTPLNGTGVGRYSLSTGNFLGGTTFPSTGFGGFYTEYNSSFGAYTYLNTSTSQSVNQGCLTTGSLTGGQINFNPIVAQTGLVYLGSGSNKYMISVVGTASGWFVARMIYDTATGNMTGGGTQPLTGFSLAGGSIPSLVASHNGFYVVGRDATNPGTHTRIQEFDDLGIFALQNNYTMAFQTPTGLFKPGIVLAPEPGTWAALGLGALALMRRKRTR